MTPLSLLHLIAVGTATDHPRSPGKGTTAFIAFLLILAASPISAQEEAYLGMSSPGTTPKIFAPGLVSTEEEYEYGSVFSADGLEFFFGVALGNRAEIRHMQFQDGKWTSPQPLISHERYGFNDPFLSPDEQRLFFISNKPPRDGDPPKDDHDIWFVKRTTTGWSEPINVGPPINTDDNEYYISFTDDGALYFASDVADTEETDNFDLYASAADGEDFLEPVLLPGDVNTKAYEADAFVAYDESYIIFSSSRRQGLGRGDLYISFRDDQGHWSAAKHMGDRINTKGHQLCPFVTRDGRYFFYTSEQDIYWVDAAIIEDFR